MPNGRAGNILGGSTLALDPRFNPALRAGRTTGPLAAGLGSAAFFLAAREQNRAARQTRAQQSLQFLRQTMTDEQILATPQGRQVFEAATGLPTEVERPFPTVGPRTRMERVPVPTEQLVGPGARPLGVTTGGLLPPTFQLTPGQVTGPVAAALGAGVRQQVTAARKAEYDARAAKLRAESAGLGDKEIMVKAIAEANDALARDPQFLILSLQDKVAADAQRDDLANFFFRTIREAGKVPKAPPITPAEDVDALADELLKQFK